MEKEQIMDENLFERAEIISTILKAEQTAFILTDPDVAVELFQYIWERPKLRKKTIIQTSKTAQA